MTELDGKLFFGAADHTNGFEVWMTDGSEDGTGLVKDINPGSAWYSLESCFC